jgi:hypothetical protein
MTKKNKTHKVFLPDGKCRYINDEVHTAFRVALDNNDKLIKHNSKFRKISWTELETYRFTKNILTAEKPALILVSNGKFLARASVATAPISISKILIPPASRIVEILELVFTKSSFQKYFAQTIADMREEYFDALNQNKKWTARWRRAQIYPTIAMVLVAWAGASVAKKFVDIWKLL